MFYVLLRSLFRLVVVVCESADFLGVDAGLAYGLDLVCGGQRLVEYGRGVAGRCQVTVRVHAARIRDPNGVVRYERRRAVDVGASRDLSSSDCLEGNYLANGVRELGLRQVFQGDEAVFPCLLREVGVDTRNGAALLARVESGYQNR